VVSDVIWLDLSLYCRQIPAWNAVHQCCDNVIVMTAGVPHEPEERAGVQRISQMADRSQHNNKQHTQQEGTARKEREHNGIADACACNPLMHTCTVHLLPCCVCLLCRLHYGRCLVPVSRCVVEDLLSALRRNGRHVAAQYFSGKWIFG
jgi:hypothetical protein